MVYPGVIELSSNEAVLMTQSAVGRIRKGAHIANRLTGSALVVATVAENIPQNLAGSVAGHDDHRPEGDVLEGHRESLVFAVPGHHLCLAAEVAKVVDRRYHNKRILSQIEHAAQ